MTSTTQPQTEFTIGQPLDYTGDSHLAPVNRPISAPYGPYPHRVSFRRYRDARHEVAEVMTSRGSRNVRVSDLKVVEVAA